ncbi:MAG TPA: hypothetical protein VGE95_00045 [Arthrobacter sp.]
MTIRAVASLLRRAWLLAAPLAVIAGLLGRHVLTSGHGSHGSASPAVHSAGHAAVAPFTAGGHAGHHAAATLAVPDHAMPDPAVPAAAACGDSCPGAQESGAPCVPSAPSGPVAITPPQAALPVHAQLTADGRAGPAYDYLPPSPTPCDLSISRT